MIYIATIWYTPVILPTGAKKRIGSVMVLREMNKVQRIAAIVVTGGMGTTVTDILKVYTGLLPIEFVLEQICHRVTARMAMLSATYPLFTPVHKCVMHNVKRYKSVLHRLFNHYCMYPQNIEIIKPVHRLLNK